MKNNNKGFTLIELLISVAIMLTIMGVAVVNFLTISDRKKTEAWGTVKSEIETAAEQYFKSNQYLFEGLSGNASASISVGMLVDEDFLNKVIDPRTGKGVSNCMIVRVSITGGVYKTVLEEGENSVECKNRSTLAISENGAPSLTVNKKCGTEGNNNWCKKGDSNDVTFTLNENENGNGKIVARTYCILKNDSDLSSIKFDNCNDTSNDTGFTQNGKKYTTKKQTTSLYNVVFMVKNSNGNVTKTLVKYGLDTIDPVIKANFQKKIKDAGDTGIMTPEKLDGSYFASTEETESDWINKDNKGVYATLDASDNSGNVNVTVTSTGSTKNYKKKDWFKRADNNYYYNINKEGKSFLSYNVCDEAGNCVDTGAYAIKIDKTDPTVPIITGYQRPNSKTLTSSSGLSTFNLNNWFSGYALIGASGSTDSLSGVEGYYLTTIGQNTDANDKKQTIRNVDKQGGVTVKYRARDVAGNYSGYAVATVNLDRVAPTVSVNAVDNSNTSVTLKDLQTINKKR